MKTYDERTMSARGRVVLAGASGLIGSALAGHLTAEGYEVVRLVRHVARDVSERSWDPARGELDPVTLDRADAVVHLGGESLARGRWNASRRRLLHDSRVTSTALLARVIATRKDRPAVFVSGSAVGIYGDRGETPLDETSAPGRGFLAELAVAWEAAAGPAARTGVRVVHPRLGVVLTPRGGALVPLLRAARLGAGGPLGSGRQWWSWVTLDDAVRALAFAIARESIAGPCVVAAGSVRQRELAAAIGRVLGRPAVLPAPAFALRLLLGGMADEMLLAGQRVRPVVLERAGFRFHDPELEPALRAMLVRT
ncbi:MAG: TIGR01777 family oxidoreductase [Candidatus Eisenbacteria bacterium]